MLDPDPKSVKAKKKQTKKNWETCLSFPSGVTRLSY